MKNRWVLAACLAILMSASAMAQDAAKKEAATEAAEQTEQTRDAASGLPTGKRQHKPLSVTKELDKSSPKSVDGPGEGKTGATRQRGAADVVENAEESAEEVQDGARASDDDVAKKTNKSESARAKKRD